MGRVISQIFFLETDEEIEETTDVLVEEEKEPEEKQEIRCGLCGANITNYEEQIALGEKAYTNPHGYIFEIGCFRNAPGCLTVGFPTEEFTWFAGYAWRYALCGRCRCHLGWHYSNGSGDTFYGLVLKRLIFPSDRS